MARPICWAILLLAGATIAVAQETKPAGLAEWMAKMTSPDPNTRAAAVADAADYGAAGVASLGKLLAGPDRGIARTARLALEAIVADAGTPGEEEKRAAVSRALVELLKADASKLVHMTEIRLLGLVGGDEAVPALARLLSDPDLREDARQALQRIPCGAATHALMEALAKADPPFRAALIASLGSRKALEAMPELISAANDPAEEVRLAALEALGQLADARAADVLRKALAEGSGLARQVAADSYLRVAEAMLAAGDRDAARLAYEELLLAAPRVSQVIAAMTGVRNIDDPRSLPAIVRALGRPDWVLQRMCMALIDKYAGDRAASLLVEAARTAEPAGKAGILLAMASRGYPDVVPLLLEGLTDQDDQVKAAAARGVGWMKVQAAESQLLGLAEKGAEQIRPLALAAYLVLLDEQRALGPKPDLLPKYNHALEIATRDQDRATALRGLAAFGDASSLVLVEPLVKAQKPLAEALQAYVAIGKNLASAQPEHAKRIFYEAIQRGASRDLANECAAQLRALGENVDFARQAGFITQWHVIGPFPNDGGRAFDAVLPPETGVDLAAEVPANGRVLKWQPLHTDDIQGVLDFKPVFTPNDDVAMCAYAEISVPTEQEVLLKIGSDDAVKCWVNGELVHANNAYRPVNVDEDVAQAKLKVGANAILVKVTQGKGDWGLCVRITDLMGNPLAFEQRTVN